MKIIGQSEDAFIIECPKDEAYNIIGYYSKYSEEKRLKVGDEILLHKMYQKVESLTRFERDFSNVSKQLRIYADVLEQLDPIIKSKLSEDIKE